MPAGDPGVSPSNLIGQTLITTPDPARFFGVYALDTQDPVITYRYPATNGIGVGRSATLVVRLDDASGVDTNAFALKINGSTSLDSASPGVLAATSGFQYTPSTNIWGDYGGTAAVEFVCADLLGNTTTSAWSFALELQPIVTNTLVHLRPPSGGAKAGLRAAMSDYGDRRGVSFSDHLSIVTMDTKQVILAYTGGGHGLYVGAVLINHDPAHFFYRRITSLVDDPPSGQVTVQTVHVQLTEIVQQGSFTPVSFSASVSSGLGPLWEEDFGYTIPFSHRVELTLLPLDITEHVRLTPGRFWVDMEGDLSVSFTVADWHLKALDTTFSTKLSAALRCSVEFRQAVSLIDWSTTIGSPITLILIPIGAVGPVPVWAEVRFVPGWGVSLEAAGAVTFETGIDAYAEADIGISWTPDGWTPTKKVIADINPVPLDIGFKLSAEAFVYLRPRLDAVLCPVPMIAPDGLAGIYADYQRGPALEAVYTLGDPQCELTLYDEHSVDFGLTVVGFDEANLANLTLFEAKVPVLTWYWPEIAEQSPVFTRHPSDITAIVGETITLAASASGSPQPTYQWYQNGFGIPFATQTRLTFTASAGASGNFYVSARNRLGRTDSNTAVVKVVSSNRSDWIQWRAEDGGNDHWYSIAKVCDDEWDYYGSGEPAIPGIRYDAAVVSSGGRLATTELPGEATFIHENLTGPAAHGVYQAYWLGAYTVASNRVFHWIGGDTVTSNQMNFPGEQWYVDWWTPDPQGLMLIPNNWWSPGQAGQDTTRSFKANGYVLERW